MYKENRKYWNGYMTIEASMLMPVVTILIVFMLYLGFYLYNVCLLQQTAYTAALRGSLLKKGSREQVRQYTQAQLKELIGERLLAISDLEQEVQVTLTKVNVSLTMSIKVPFVHLVSEHVSLWNYQAKVSVKRIDPVSIIRGIRKLENL